MGTEKCRFCDPRHKCTCASARKAEMRTEPCETCGGPAGDEEVESLYRQLREAQKNFVLLTEKNKTMRDELRMAIESRDNWKVLANMRSEMYNASAASALPDRREED